MNWLSRLKYSPFVTQLVVTRHCNLSCAYCNEYSNQAHPLPLKTLIKRANKLKSLGAYSITLTGGEPLTHPEIFELIRCCRYDLKFFRTTLISNGFLLTTDNIEKLNVAGLQDLQISVDGIYSNEQTKKSLSLLRKNLHHLKKLARFNVIVSSVVGACPPYEAVAVTKYTKRLGFRPRVLLIHDEDGQITLDREQMLAYNQIKDILPKHLYELSNYRDHLIKKGSAPFKCRAGSRYLYVDEDGKVRWCSQKKNLFEKDLMEYTHHDLRREFYSYKNCHTKCTLGCVRSASFFDEWRRQDFAR